MSSLPPPPPQLEVDDVLEEILLRLPPKPSSLPRASAVCRRWFRVVSGPGFSGRFRTHHRAKLPLLGCFVADGEEFYFEPTMDPPDRVPRGRFPSQPLPDDSRLLGCRHGLVLLYSVDQFQLKVWDPVSGAEHAIAHPPEFGSTVHIDGAVLRSATAADHEHFQVVLVSVEDENTPERTRVNGCVYSSESGSWGDLISTPLPNAPESLFMSKANVLVGDSLYWLLSGDPVRILEFNLVTKSLAVSATPVEINTFARQSPQYSLMEADDGELGFLTISGFKAQLWTRKLDSHGDSSWVLGRTIELDKILPQTQMPSLTIAGLAQKNNVLFIFTAPGVFRVNLQSLQCNQVSDALSICGYHPFESVYTTDCEKFKDLLEEIVEESLAKDEGESEECPSAAGLPEKLSVSESKAEEEEKARLEGSKIKHWTMDCDE